MKHGFIIVLIVTLTSFAQAQGDTVGNGVEMPVRFQGVASIGINMYIGGGYKYGTTLLDVPYLQLNLGVRIREKAYVGMGIGAVMPLLYNRPAIAPFPFLVHTVRGDVYLPGGRLNPYVSIQWGVLNMLFDMSRYLLTFGMVGVGFDYKWLTFQVGYSPLLDIDYGDGCNAEHGVYFEIGYRFNTHKYVQAHKR